MIVHAREDLILRCLPWVFYILAVPFQLFQQPRIFTGCIARPPLLARLKMVCYLTVAVLYGWCAATASDNWKLAVSVFNCAGVCVMLFLYILGLGWGRFSCALTNITLAAALTVHTAQWIGDALEGEWSAPSILLLVSLWTLNGLMLRGDDSDKNEKAHAMDRTTLFQSLFLTFYSGIVERGRRGELEMSHLMPNYPEMESEHLIERWNHTWMRMLTACESHAGHLNDALFSHSSQRGSIADSKRASFIKHLPFSISIQYSKKGSAASVTRAMWRLYGWRMVGLTALFAVGDAAAFCTPAVLGRVLALVSSPTATLSSAVAYSIALFALSEFRSFISNHCICQLFHIATQACAMLTNAVFQKSLRLSPSARLSRTRGEQLNHVAIDIEKLMLLGPYLPVIGIIPITICIGLFQLVSILGWAGLAGMSVMLAFIPLNYAMSKMVKNWQVIQMRLKDERCKLANEVISGIKVVKLYAWEQAFEEKIEELRKKELHYLYKSALCTNIMAGLNDSSPFLVAIASFSVYLCFPGNTLTPQVAFVSLVVFNLLRTPMRLTASLLNVLVQGMVALSRLDSFFHAAEMTSYVMPGDDETAVCIDRGVFTWDGPPSLSLSLRVLPAQSVAVVGPVGSGKSSLLNAIIGEMSALSGSVSVSGRLAYCPQQPWLRNASMRENIVFGEEWDEALYHEVTRAAQIQDDFALFPAGDSTEVGENGINLSGGQKARVGVARALYQRADVYLLDDPLSAVDAHVGTAMYHALFGDSGLLRGKSTILVTHGLQYTKRLDRVVVMKDGCISEEGSYAQLLDNDGYFAQMVKSKEKHGAKTERTQEEVEEVKPTSNIVSGSDGKLIKAEGMQKGQVAGNVYVSYTRACRIQTVLFFFITYTLSFVCQTEKSLWLSEWSNENNIVIPNDNTTVEVMNPFLRLAGYAGFGMGEVLWVVVAFVLFSSACSAASRRLHSPLLASILRAPMHFFDTTPTGRILNRMTGDMDVIDSQLPTSLMRGISAIFSLITILVVISIVTPVFLAIIPPLAAGYYYLLVVYVPSARQLKRLEGVHRSPVFSLFGEAIDGIASIRAHYKVDSVCASFSSRVDALSRCRLASRVLSRWQVIRLEVIGNIVVLAASLLGVIASRLWGVSAGLVGLSVSFALQVCDQLNVGGRMVAEMEAQIVAVERVDEYTKIEPEACWSCSDPPASEWPSEGQIQWNDYACRYRAGLPLVVRGVRLEMKSGEKVAVVGRTGSGKSSLTLGLFRIIEAAEGGIFIDGRDIASIGLHELRQKITIIPQDPVLFTGTVRFNLDPFGEYTDEHIWAALEACQLREYIASLPHTLQYIISEGGKNMSVGQRQLVCLGRALLRGGKILVLDEATASVDGETDALVQSVVAQHFQHSTVIAIAHRLHTIHTYDKVVVLDRGVVVEVGAPSHLVSHPHSHYSRMIEKSHQQ